MAKKRKEELAELKAPDQFVSFWSRVGEKMARHRNALLTVVVTVLAATAALQAGRTYFGKRDGNTSKAFARIERIAAAALLPAEGDPPKFDDGLPRFKTDEERKQAGIREADAFLAAHNRGKLAAMARLLKAGYLSDLGKPGEALPLYEALVAGDELPADLQILALDGLALAQEAMGKEDAALASFEKLSAAAKAQDGFFADRAAYNKARLLEKQGKTEEARKLYRDITSSFPNSQLRQEATRRLALLEQGGADGAAQGTGSATP